mmetsp:Transcript_15701/g.52858  ORF Transcript_15701/g.52858 Transcript_15701/m.52858 type:complete len:144 (+) Transcript_15701:8-439(+)
MDAGALAASSHLATSTPGGPLPRLSMSYRDAHSFESRRTQALAIRAKHPDRIPIIVEKRPRDATLPLIDKKKFLVPADLTVGQFVYVIRKRIALKPEQAIFLFVSKGTLPPTVATCQAVYDSHKDEDGFLYMTYSGENTFGTV